MSFVGIDVFNLISGIYYDGEGASEVNALKTDKSKWHSVRNSHTTRHNLIKIP
jgi:hypothetical protein